MKICILIRLSCFLFIHPIYIFIVNGWASPFAAPNKMVPVRFELQGTQNLNTTFHFIGDYIDFSPSPTFDLEKLQVRCFFRRSLSDENQVSHEDAYQPFQHWITTIYSSIRFVGFNESGL